LSGSSHALRVCETATTLRAELNPNSQPRPRKTAATHRQRKVGGRQAGRLVHGRWRAFLRCGYRRLHSSLRRSGWISMGRLFPFRRTAGRRRWWCPLPRRELLPGAQVRINLGSRERRSATAAPFSAIRRVQTFRRLRRQRCSGPPPPGPPGRWRLRSRPAGRSVRIFKGMIAPPRSSLISLHAQPEGKQMFFCARDAADAPLSPSLCWRCGLSRCRGGTRTAGPSA
jgi:hypothetical protein